MSLRSRRVLLATGAALLAAPATAHAYIGPGAGFALVSSFLTLIIAFFTAFRRALHVSRADVLALDPPEKTRAQTQGRKGRNPRSRRTRSGDLREAHGRRRAAQFLEASRGRQLPPAGNFDTGDVARRLVIVRHRGRRVAPRYLRFSLAGSANLSSPPFVIERLRRGALREDRPAHDPIEEGRRAFLEKERELLEGARRIRDLLHRAPRPDHFPPGKDQRDHSLRNGRPRSARDDGVVHVFHPGRVRGRHRRYGREARRATGRRSRASIPGPTSPLDGKPLELPLEISVSAKKNGATIRVGGESHFVKEREYSPWVRMQLQGRGERQAERNRAFLHHSARWAISRCT